MGRQTYSVLRINPCICRERLKTNSYRTIDDILKAKLETILEEPPPTAVTPSPRVAKRTVSMKLNKRPQGGWYMKISKISTTVVAPFSSLGDSYVRMMNAFAQRGQMGSLTAVPFHCSIGPMGM